VWSAASAQTTRRVTNIAALTAFPSFYHTRPIVLVGTLAQSANGEFRLSDDSGSVRGRLGKGGRALRVRSGDGSIAINRR